VPKRFYRKAREGVPATLLLLREEAAGIRVAGVTYWFLPKVGQALLAWLFLAYGLHFGTDLVLDLVFGAVITGLGVWMLLVSLKGVEER